MSTATDSVNMNTPAPALRPPARVMRLSRMGCFHQTRISFMRSLVRRIVAERWRLQRPQFELDDDGYGTAVYRVVMPAGVCSLVAFSHELRPEQRSDRVIAEKWDATFALVLGTPGEDEIEVLRANVPRQEAGRCGPRAVVLSRANKSVRLFEHVVDCLAHGWQPAIEDIVDVGYLMRTTAVYGNGKFGLSDLSNTFSSGLFGRPFEAEMLAVYLIREFTIDLVNHVAARRFPERAVKLAKAQARALGIGNSTGLGMAPFLIAHPILIHRWMLARESAIATVLAQAEAAKDKRKAFVSLLGQAQRHVHEWMTTDTRQAERIGRLRDELQWLSELVPNPDAEILSGSLPWKRLVQRVETCCSGELQELLHSLIIEPYGELVDGLADTMSDPEIPVFDPAMRLRELRTLIEKHYDWARAIDFSKPEAQHFFWYRSAEKEEPRLGERRTEPGAEKEMRLGIGQAVQSLDRALSAEDPHERVAAFLLRQPQWHRSVRRVQTIARYPYGEIQDNLLASNCMPIDILRCKLSFFGAIKFDPKSDRWTRITMYQGAPRFQELDADNANAAFLPAFIGDQPALHA